MSKLNQSIPEHVLLAMENHGNKLEDFVLVELDTFADRMNDGMYYNQGKSKYLVPDYMENDVHTVHLTFDLTFIFYNKKGRELFRSAHPEFYDVATPIVYPLD